MLTDIDNQKSCYHEVDNHRCLGTTRDPLVATLTSNALSCHLYVEDIVKPKVGYVPKTTNVEADQEKSVLSFIKKGVSQKDQLKELLKWYENVKDQDEEETHEQDDEIDEEAEDGKDDSDNELWCPKTIGTTKPIRNCINGLANNKTWEMIVNKEFGVIKEDVKEQVKESKEQERSNDFGLWRVKTRCLLIQHGGKGAFDPFSKSMTDAEKTAALKTNVYKKAHSAYSYAWIIRRGFLFVFNEFNGGTVLLDDNRACVIKGPGKVRVHMKDGSSFVIENVRYILEFKRDLISLGILDQEDYTVKLQNGKINMIKGSLMVISRTMNENCVYSLDGSAKSDEASVVYNQRRILYRCGINVSIFIVGEEYTYAFMVGGHPANYEMLRYLVALFIQGESREEVKYMTLTKAVKESIWLKGILIKLRANVRSMVVNYDNQSAIYLSRNAMFHERTKHINLRYHFIREIIESKEIEVAKIGTKDNVAHAFTKVVPSPKFKYCIEILGVGVN
nr:retrovirus-related Pol polyprotein from transposon TNT 1-94 [Tanacetum cinerariifolium]